MMFSITVSKGLVDSSAFRRRDLVDETDVRFMVARDAGVLAQMRLPERLLGGEMDLDVIAQLVEHRIERGGVGLEGEMRDETVQQCHELLVLCIDDRDAGGEVAVPREDLPSR